MAGAPGKLPYAEEVYRYMRMLERASPRVRVYSIGTTEEGREMIAANRSDSLGLGRVLLMPAALLQFLPLVSNARMPGRAMVVVYLALGVLMALRLAALSERREKSAAEPLMARESTAARMTSKTASNGVFRESERLCPSRTATSVTRKTMIPRSEI